MAFAPGSAAAQDNDAAELAEARAIVGVAFPPTERDQMMRSLIQQFASQVEAADPMQVEAIGDPGLTKLIGDFRGKMLDDMMPLVKGHLPKILEATAVAYTHEFDLAELKEMHAFAETPTGRHYLSRSSALIADPAVAEVNTAYIRDLQTLAATKKAELKDQLMAYLKAHPAVAMKVADAVNASTN
jgi:hypothetical protein